MPRLRGRRPLKRWTWVGAFGPELMLCAARASIGGLPVAWWAVWDREAGWFAGRTARGRGGVSVSPSGVAVRGRAVSLSLALGGGAAVEVVSPHGEGGYAWTRKHGGVPATGWIAVRGGARRAVELHAIVDESAGYHARNTAWRWSAGVGTAASGAAVAWNLVAGMHDAASGSERTVWVDGVPHEVGPVAFGDDLACVGALRFAAGPVRARRERLGPLLASDYVQPFGTFSGTLPVAGGLLRGWGVMERHEARW
jgi:hypothetical protein